MGYGKENSYGDYSSHLNELWDYVMFLKAWGSGKYTPIQKKKRKGDGDNRRGRGRGGGRVLKL